VLDTIGKAGAGFKSLADTWADTTTPHGRLMLTVLGGLAEFERESINGYCADVWSESHNDKSAAIKKKSFKIFA
jgi:DNA invertase Pin-like site-specific DNA recombinase